MIAVAGIGIAFICIHLMILGLYLRDIRGLLRSIDQFNRIK